MSFGENLQILRKMRNNMTQEELAEKLGVSRQTVSKWELDATYPEIGKLMELCDFFSCSMDRLLRENMAMGNEAYSHIRLEDVPSFRYIRYAVISGEPEEDAIGHVRGWANELGLIDPQIIGWDFPVVSLEQVNVYHMHGYAAACILPADLRLECRKAEIVTQNTQKYAAITIKEPFHAPFELIPNSYKTLMLYMQMNGVKHKADPMVLECFEKSYVKEGIHYMDVYIAAED